MSPPPAQPGRPQRWSRQASTQATFDAGRAVVGLVDNTAAEAVAADHGLRVTALESSLRAMAVSGTAGRLRELAASGDPRVRYVEPARRVRFLHRRNDPRVNLVDSATGQPYEWTFAQLGADQALNLGHGSPTFLVGVVDTGVDEVPDLQGKVAQVFYLPSETPDGADDFGHGTFVSSIIASNNDDGIGLAGFCGQCRIVMYKIEEYFDASAAIVRLVDAGVRVINLSIGGPAGDTSAALTDGVNYASAHGVLVVASAGNDGAGQLSYPARQLQTTDAQPGPGLAVGASDVTGHRTSWSNYGSGLSLLAPGGFSDDPCLGVFGAIPLSFNIFDAISCTEPLEDQTTGARYAYGEGTSFSAPEVAGIAALVWAAAPTRTSTEIAGVLAETATRPAGTGWSPDSGWGIVNAAKAMEAVTGKSSADRIALSRVGVTPGRPAAGALVQFGASVAWSDGAALEAASATCTLSVAGRRIGVKGQVAGTAVVCQLRVPKTAAGRRASVTMTVASAGLRTTTTFTLLVKPPAKKR